MADVKPPRLTAGGERRTVRLLTQYQRESVVRKLDGLTDDEARRVLVPSGTSLLWIIKHLARAELLWVCQRFAGHDVALPDDALGATDTIDSVVRAYRAAWDTVDAVADAASLDDHCEDVGAESMVDLRWVLTHLLEETARHAGHADILRELLDGTTGR
ncbi:MAG TPA: DinB family protein [Acidimicrobiales bacterium]|nr:DinB family protein [Acidimicrobiales bacterium]